MKPNGYAYEISAADTSTCINNFLGDTFPPEFVNTLILRDLFIKKILD